jgi:hypothetical protein
VAAAQEKPTRIGVIEALGRGFEVAARTPWVVGLPIFLDLFLWRGPQLSAAPLVDWVMNAYQRGAASRVLGDLGTLPPEALDATREALMRFNVFATLAFNLVALPTSAQTRPALGPVIATLEHPLSVVMAILGLEIVGMALGCLFFAGLAQQVRYGVVHIGGVLQSVPRYWLRFALIILVALLLPFVIGLPVGLLLAIVAMMSPVAAQVIGTMLLVAAQVAIVWLAIYLFFVIDAVVVSDLGARAAVETSVRIVSRNFWAALGLIVLSFVIAQGMFQIWALLSQSTLGSLVAIVGHAYVASGLAAASMAFYWNRVQHEQEA